MKRTATYALILISTAFSTANGQATPTWSNNYATNLTGVNNSFGRPGVAAAWFNNQIYVAFAGTCQNSACPIAIAHSFAPGTLNFTYNANVSAAPSTFNPTYPVGTVTTANVPALTVQANLLYLAYTDTSNNMWLLSSPDGSTWSSATSLSSGYNANWSPSLTADPTNTARIYAGFADKNSHTPIICAVYVNNGPNGVQNCENFTSLLPMNFWPALFSWSTVTSGVVMAYEAFSDSHCLSGYVLNPETGYSYDYNASQSCSDSTSATPSLAAYNSRLFLSWGGNNSNRQFNIRATDPNQLTFDVPKQPLPEYMAGGSTILYITPSGYGSGLINFYIYNNTVRYMYGQYPPATF